MFGARNSPLPPGTFPTGRGFHLCEHSSFITDTIMLPKWLLALTLIATLAGEHLP